MLPNQFSKTDTFLREKGRLFLGTDIIPYWLDTSTRVGYGYLGISVHDNQKQLIITELKFKTGINLPRVPVNRGDWLKKPFEYLVIENDQPLKRDCEFAFKTFKNKRAEEKEYDQTNGGGLILPLYNSLKKLLNGTGSSVTGSEIEVWGEREEIKVIFDSVKEFLYDYICTKLGTTYVNYAY